MPRLKTKSSRNTSGSSVVKVDLCYRDRFEFVRWTIGVAVKSRIEVGEGGVTEDSKSGLVVMCTLGSDDF